MEGLETQQDGVDSVFSTAEARPKARHVPVRIMTVVVSLDIYFVFELVWAGLWQPAQLGELLATVGDNSVVAGVADDVVGLFSLSYCGDFGAAVATGMLTYSNILVDAAAS